MTIHRLCVEVSAHNIVYTYGLRSFIVAKMGFDAAFFFLHFHSEQNIKGNEK